MAKKKEDGGMFSFLGELVLELLKLSSIVKDISDKIKSEIDQKVHEVQMGMASMFMFLLSFVFILVSGVFLLKTYWGVDYGVSLLGIGIILLMVGVYFKQAIKVK